LRKLIFSFLLASVIIFNTIGVSAADSLSNPTIDTQQLSSGIVKVSYNSASDKKIKVAIEKSGKKLYYNLNNDGISENFPLQLGNGDYKVTVFENISGTKYKSVSSENVSLNLSNSNLLYLNSIQNINWNYNMSAIKKAAELTKGLKTDKEKINAIYGYIVSSVKYDYKKMSTISSTYVPDIDSTYKSGKGICYDFSSIFASMLRSVKIPAKLVMGYSVNVKGYHSWNEVYDSQAGKWLVIDPTYDSQMKAAKVKYSMVKTSSNYSKVYEY
jgi:hypothetical protein